MGIKTNRPRNYLESYEKEISPKLKNIDVLLKSEQYPLNISKTSDVLDISEDEVKQIMCEEAIKEIDRYGFFSIMKKGSSDICRLFNRELKCGSPYFYSIKDISYIYDIDIKYIKNACDFLEIDQITSHILPLLFAQIPVNT